MPKPRLSEFAKKTFPHRGQGHVRKRKYATTSNPMPQSSGPIRASLQPQDVPRSIGVGITNSNAIETTGRPRQTSKS
jgi:hypothetical protein